MSTVPTGSRTMKDTVASALKSRPPHPLPVLLSLHQNQPARLNVQDSMHSNVPEMTGLLEINDTVLRGRISGQESVNESAAAVIMSNTTDSESARAPRELQHTISPPLPSDVPSHESQDDNRVFGPKMDLPRMGLKLLSSFQNKEHATFGFVATTPRPVSFYPLEGACRILQ